MNEIEIIYQKYYKFVKGYDFTLCFDESLAEDITQETFFKAIKSYEKFNHKCKVETWLCQIAKNTYFAWYNEQQRKQPISQPISADSTPDIAELFEEKELAGRAFSVLHALEEPYKEVFMLSVFGGLSLKDISAMFGKSESWARVTYYRAKQKIMEGLGR